MYVEYEIKCNGIFFPFDNPTYEICFCEKVQMSRQYYALGR